MTLQMQGTSTDPQMRQHLQECIQNCLDCAQACETCFAECVRMEMPGMAECIAACRDCADICLLDAQLMSRESPIHFDTCELCAKICDQCAEACRKASSQHNQGQQSSTLQQCADACERCAQTCRAMAAMRTGMH